MKNLARLKRLKWIITLLIFNLLQTALLAQDNSGGSSGSSSSTTTTTHVNSTSDQSGNWYASPWVWVVGAAILILIIVALSSGNKKTAGSTDRVTVTKSVRRDTDTDAV